MATNFPKPEYELFCKTFYEGTTEALTKLTDVFEAVIDFYRDCRLQMQHTIAKETWE